MKLDLNALCETLQGDEPRSLLESTLLLLERHNGPYDPHRLLETDWRELVFPGPVSQRLHKDTVKRLESGTLSEPADPDQEPVFRKIRGRAEPELTGVLRQLRRAFTPYDDWLRNGPIQASAGYSNLVALFPPPDRLLPALRNACSFRRASPLPHPVWNTLLLYLLLLRIHPFRDGNGRTARALISYELWRLGFITPSLLPLKRLLDANRANEIETRLNIANASSPAAANAAVCKAMCFDLKLIGETARRSG